MSLAFDFRQKATAIWHMQRVKRMVRDVGGLGPQTMVSVSEIDCDDPVCPGAATQITILSFDLVRRRYVIHRPLVDVTLGDLENFRF